MKAQLATLQVKIDEEKARMRAAGLAKIKAIIIEYELTIADLTAPKKKRGFEAGKASMPMYQAFVEGRGQADIMEHGRRVKRFRVANHPFPLRGQSAPKIDVRRMLDRRSLSVSRIYCVTSRANFLSGMVTSEISITMIHAPSNA